MAVVTTIVLLAGLWLSPVDADARPETRRARQIARLEASGKVGGGVLTAFETRYRVPVVIGLDSEFRKVRSALRLKRRHFSPGHRFRSDHVVAGDLSLRGALRLIRAKALRGIELDRGGKGALLETRALVHAETANALGYLGYGITIAYLDSGIDTDHPDLVHGLLEQHCVSSAGRCPDGTNAQSGAGAAEDDNGHGTMVAGVMASRGRVAARGLAPQAKLVAVKVLDANLAFERTSDVLAGLIWLRDRMRNEVESEKGELELDVVNLSLETLDTYEGVCDDQGELNRLLADVVAELNALGVTLVAASGNGSETDRLPSPACLSGVIAVGAAYDSDVGPRAYSDCADITTETDQPMCFSRSDDTLELFAPGARMTSSNVGGGVRTRSGTSFAAPVVAGCAALIQDQNAGHGPDEIRDAMSRSPVWVEQGGRCVPRLDCAMALGLAVEGEGLENGDSKTRSSDVDGDGMPNGCDNCPLVPNFDSNSAGTQPDADADGVGDACQCSGPTRIAGDANDDGVVDGADYAIWADHFGMAWVLYRDGDFNCDGRVDGADYVIWADHFGTANPLRAALGD